MSSTLSLHNPILEVNDIDTSARCTSKLRKELLKAITVPHKVMESDVLINKYKDTKKQNKEVLSLTTKSGPNINMNVLRHSNPNEEQNKNECMIVLPRYKFGLLSISPVGSNFPTTFQGQVSPAPNKCNSDLVNTETDKPEEPRKSLCSKQENISRKSIDWTIRRRPTEEEVAVLKSDEAEQFLQALGNALLKSCSKCPKVISNSPVTSSKSKLVSKTKKKRVNKRKLKINKKNTRIADLSLLTKNLQSIERELETNQCLESNSRYSRRKYSSVTRETMFQHQLISAKQNTRKEEGCLPPTSPAFGNQSLSTASCEYARQFKNYKISVDKLSENTKALRWKKSLNQNLEISVKDIPQLLTSEIGIKNMSRDHPKSGGLVYSTFSLENDSTHNQSSHERKSSKNSKGKTLKKKSKRKLTSNMLTDYQVKNVTQITLSKQSSCNDSVLGSDFNEFLSAYGEHVLSQSKNTCPVKKKLEASRVFTDNSTLAREATSQHLIAKSVPIQKRKRTTKRMESVFCGTPDKKMSQSDFKIFPLPTHKVVSVMNCLKQIEDESEDIF